MVAVFPRSTPTAEVARRIQETLDGRSAYVEKLGAEAGFSRRDLAYLDIRRVLAMNAESARWTAAVPDGGQRTVTVMLAALADGRELVADLRARAEASGVSAGKVMQSLRVAITGQRVSPGIFETMAAMGKDLVAERLEAAS